MQSWNLIGKDGVPLQIVNRTNNALESYNRRFNKIFSKQPTLIKFAMLIEEESRHQTQIRQDIITGKKREPKRTKIWIPELPESYLQFKEEFLYLGSPISMVDNALKDAADTTSKSGCAGCKKSVKDESGCKKVESAPSKIAGRKKAAEDDAATSKSGCKKVEAAPSKKQGRKAAATEHQVIAEPVVAEKWGGGRVRGSQ